MTSSYDPRAHGADCANCPLRGTPVVPPNVNANARAIIIGEAPGKEEVEQGRPFVGASGLELNRALKLCGVDRRTLHITNTLLCQPPENNYAKLEKQRAKAIKKGAPGKLASQCCLPRLLNEIAAHPCANLITLGSTAFKAVSRSDSSVMSVRGGPREIVVAGADDVGITKRLLPTVHPAFVMRARRWTRAFNSDMSRAFRWFSTGLGWQDPRMGVAPRPDQLRGWIDKHRRDRFIVCDVETLPGFPDVGHFDPLFDKLTVIGLGSEDGREAIVIPIRTKDGVPRYSAADFAVIRAILIDFFRAPTIVKAGWNFGYYDRMVIAARLGVEPLPIVDGIGLHKMVEPELPHRLGYVGSICTDAPSWKEDHTATTYETDEQLWLYNARDNAITAMSVTQCIRGVKERDQVRAAQFWPKVQETCIGLHRNGMRVDQAKRRAYDHDLLVEAIRLRKEIRERIDLPKFNPNSTPQLQDLLFESWGLLPTFYTDAGDPSTNDDSLRSFLMQPSLDPSRKAVIKALRAYRAAVKLRGTYVTKLAPITEPIKVPELAWDEDESPEEREDRIKKDGKKHGICLPDGRVHPDYSAHGTVGWRLSSSRPNAQNFPDDLRDMIIPAEGNILVGCDEAQLELRMVAGLSGASMYCAAFSAGEDPHLDLCRAFFGDVFERASKDGKKKLRVLIKQFTYACAAEGTLVATLDEAGEKPIEKLEPGVDFVWCWDGEKYAAVRVKTKTNNGTRPCYRVTYEWIVPGESTPRRASVEFTGDHLFIMRDGSDKRVDDLRPGDALMPFGRWKVGRYRVLDRFNDRGRVAEHRAVMDYDGEGHVHHRDGNGCNNLPTNLEVCSVHDHLAGHWTEERREEHRVVNRALWADGQTMNAKLTVGRMSSEKWREAVRRNIEKAREIRAQTGASNKGQTWSKLDAFRGQIGVLLDRDVAKLAGVTQAAISYYRRTRKIPPPPGQRVNHRVVSVEFVGDRQVWDIEVDHPAHNFALAAGIFVHNSVYRAEPGTIWEILTSGEEYVCPDCGTPLQRKSSRCAAHPSAYPEKRLVFPELTIRETTALHQTWLGRNPEIEKWWERDLAEYKRQGFLAEPIFGLKRDFLDGEEINEIANYKAQSGGSALVHIATERVKDAIPFEKWGPGTGIIQQGHDALVVECPRDQAEWVKTILEESMKEDGTPYGMPLPFIGEGKIGSTWRDV